MPGLAPRQRTARALLVGVALAVLAALASPLAAQEARHIRHILVPEEAHADALLERLAGGADFRDLARKYSRDVGTKPLGGDLDWVLPQSLETEFARAAWGIEEKGGYAKAQTRHGWHVIEYVDSRPAPEARPIPPAQPPRPAGPAPVPPVHVQPDGALAVRMVWPEVMFRPGEPVSFAIEMENLSKEPIDVFHPDLWPLGLLVRYQFGLMNQNAMFPEGWDGTPPEGISKTLPPGETLRSDFTLQDYFGERPDWPIIRLIWRGDALFSRLEKLLPTVIEAEGYPERKGRWRHYISEESRISILPEYQPGDRWVLCAYSRGRTWIEIHDPGVPGLVERLIENVRTERYTDAQLSQYHPTDFFAAWLPAAKDPIPFAQPERAIAWNAGTVGLAIEWRGDGAVIGDSLCVALEQPDGIVGRAVPVGRIVHTEGNPIERTTEVLAQGQTTPLSLLLAYPWELAPEEVRAAADALPEPEPLAEAMDPDPSAGWKPIAPMPVAPRRSEPPRVAEDMGKADDHAGHGHEGHDHGELKLADDLPRVALVTDQGKVIVELFEDDAPNTVANFIRLVETGFYRDNEVVRKVGNPSNRGFIQTGSPDNTDQGTPGYTIPDERNEHRHQRGSLSMAKKHMVPNSAGSQFFICLESQPQLDGDYTVFGHVIEGLEIIDRLREKDVIRSMAVVRKRDHEYVPRTFPQ